MQLSSKIILVNIAAVNVARFILISIDFVGLGASFSIVCKNIACYHVRKGLVLHMQFLKCINYEEAKYFFYYLRVPGRDIFL